MTESTSISVLYVDDDPDFAELAAEMLEREDDRFTVETAPSASEGLTRLSEREFDCLVSDYEMPRMNGIEFVDTVREDYPDLPVILFTGKGSEEVASEAISVGVTDYFQKEAGTDQYRVLSNRILHAVESYRSQQALTERNRRLRKFERMVNSMQEAACIYDADGRFEIVNDYLADWYGTSRDDLEGRQSTLVSQIRAQGDTDQYEELLEGTRQHVRGELEDTFPGHGHAVIEYRLTPLTIDGHIEGIVGVARDITEYKEREQELSYYETLVETIDDGVYVVNEAGQFVMVNEAYAEMFGYDREDLVGEDVSVVVDADLANRARQLDAEMRRGTTETPVIEAELQTADRDRAFLEAQFALLSGADDQTYRVGVVRDVTERRVREQELERERDRLAALFAAIPEPVVTVEFTDDGPILRAVNDAFEDTFGYEADETIGENINDLIVPDEASERAEATRIDEQAQTGEQLTREVRREAHDGVRDFLFRSVPIEENGELSQQFGVYIDISEHKRREEALSALHDASRDLMEAPDKRTVAEHAVETARTVLDQPINGLWLHDPDDDVLQPAAMTDDAADLLAEQPVYTGEGSLTWQAFEAGELRVYDDVQTEPDRLNPQTAIRSEIIIPLGDHGVMNIGATEAASFSDVDISLARILGKTVETALGRAQREQQLRTQRAALRRQNERLEKFTSVVSHDLRNPLQVADGRLELARAECDSDHLDGIADALDRMDTLIEDLLTLARQGEQVQEMEPVVLAETVGSCWQSVQTADATLSTDSEQRLQADKSRLKQLLENLFRNAVDHGGDNVTVTVGDLDDGFYVADDGPGIPAEKREAVFDAGYSTADSGTGFGLNIVQEIAEAHGWDVAVTDSTAGGARFEITGVHTSD